MRNNNSQTRSYTTETVEGSITIGIATTPAEKREIYHLRYQIYVGEMCKHVEGVDYANQLLYDDLDEWCFLFYAKVGSEVIATARINIGTFADFPQKLVELLSLETFQNDITEHGDPKICYFAKLMVAPAHRGSPVLYLLMVKCYEICCNNQVQFGFSLCHFHLLRLYEQMGFHRYSKNLVYPGYGLITPIVLTDDIEHFRRVRSPLYRIARKKGAINTQPVEWFHATFTKHSQIINSQLVTEEELWSILCKRLDCPPTEVIAVLRNLSIVEAKKFLHCCGVFVQCDAGDIITSQGDISYAHNILLSGKLNSLTFQRPVKEYTLPGQYFGANGLTEHNKHTEDIAAVDSVEILVLSGLAFQKFFHTCPDIAHKIVQNLLSVTKNKLLNIT